MVRRGGDIFEAFKTEKCIKESVLESKEMLTNVKENSVKR